MNDAALPCATHPDARSLARCHGCDRGMCEDCWRTDVDERPACAHCAHLLTRPPSALLYSVFVLVACALGGLIVRKIEAPLGVQIGILASLALSLVIAAVFRFLRVRRRHAARVVRPRPERASPPEGHASGSPYRGRLRRLGRALAPPVSGKVAAAVVLGALGLSAGVVPSALALPRWVETELVLLVWWAVWTVAFTVLLVRGWRLSHDLPRGFSEAASRDPRKKKAGGGFDGIDLGGLDIASGAGEGCAVVGLILLFVCVTALAAWLLLELVLPALLVVTYWLVLRGLTRVANDRHGCEGRPARALLWGLLWATLYTAPLAAAVLLSHVALGLLGP